MKTKKKENKQTMQVNEREKNKTNRYHQMKHQNNKTKKSFPENIEQCKNIFIIKIVIINDKDLR